eukprot:6179749-Pleurochrysis_carterae.AAC.1
MSVWTETRPDKYRGNSQLCNGGLYSYPHHVVNASLDLSYNPRTELQYISIKRYLEPVLGPRFCHFWGEASVLGARARGRG